MQQEATGWNPVNPGGWRIIESAAGAGLREVGFADEIARIKHNGWYCNEYGETFRGVVLQLPARAGVPRYLAGYRNPWNDSIAVDVARGVIEGERGGVEGSMRDSDGAREAARAADDFAEKQAETEREYQRAWSAGSSYADAIELARSTRLERRNYVRELCNTCRAAKAAGLAVPPAVRSALLGRIDELKAQGQAAYDEARRYLENREQAGGPANGWSNEHESAFAEGAGLAAFPQI